MPTHVTVNEWVEMFRAIGLTEHQMHRWHEEFERRYPVAHDAFLAWLGLPADKIASIREASARGQR
jgi:hypothetical protein